MEQIRPKDGRWAVLGDIAKLRSPLDLTPSSLQVLTALLSFLPAGSFGTAPMVVFPSNETLCARASEMNERTLRRHLNRLIEAGLVLRAASANGKRFCKRAHSGEILQAFGFDLSPLAARALELNEAAEALRAEEAALKATRSRIAAKIYSLQIAEAYKNQLRRKLTLDELLALEASLPTQIEEDLSATDGQNVRHIEDKTTEVLDESAGQILAPSRDLPSFELCRTSLASVLEFAAHLPRSWEDFIELSKKIAPWIGLEPAQIVKSRKAWGLLPSALVLLSLAARSKTIQHPKAYLDKLLSNATAPNIAALLRGSRREFTGVNG